MQLGNIFQLRESADANAINESVDGKKVVIVGSSFIGMEAAASVAKRAASVTVIGMEKVPFERVLGERIGASLQKVSSYSWNNLKFASCTKIIILNLNCNVLSKSSKGVIRLPLLF